MPKSKRNKTKIKTPRILNELEKQEQQQLIQHEENMYRKQRMIFHSYKGEDTVPKYDTGEVIE